jgi:hypothetical protein
MLEYNIYFINIITNRSRREKRSYSQDEVIVWYLFGIIAIRQCNTELKELAKTATSKSRGSQGFSINFSAIRNASLNACGRKLKQPFA